ncbi:FkbM family methyltransferase, partial [Candidatus Margulisiibacteriota bacterium]
MPKDIITVDCVSLSSFINDKKFQHIDFIKMDIEGSERVVIQDLNANNQLIKVNKCAIEYHHKISGHRSSLSEFLHIFEKNGFEYQIDTSSIPITAENTFQDILLYFYK